MTEKFDPYAALGISPGASAEEITAAFRRAAAAAHPDREGGSTERMADVNVAYEILGDAERRAQYDRTGHVGVATAVLDKRAVDFMRPMVGVIIRHDPIATGIVAPLRTALINQKASLREGRVRCASEIAHLEELKLRVAGPPDNFILGVLDQEISRGRATLQAQDVDEQVIDRALEILTGYGDKEPIDIGSLVYGGIHLLTG